MDYSFKVEKGMVAKDHSLEPLNIQNSKRMCMGQR
jgi:hypothetical protein